MPQLFFPGREVVYAANPLLYGVGIIEYIEVNGQVHVTLDDGTHEQFDKDELAIFKDPCSTKGTKKK